MLTVESACSEALFLLCWMLTANLKQRLANEDVNISDATTTSSADRRRALASAQNATDLEMAQECITTLRTKASQELVERFDTLKLPIKVNKDGSSNSLSTTVSTVCV